MKNRACNANWHLFRIVWNELEVSKYKKIFTKHKWKVGDVDACG